MWGENLRDLMRHLFVVAAAWSIFLKPYAGFIIFSCRDTCDIYESEKRVGLITAFGLLHIYLYHGDPGMSEIKLQPGGHDCGREFEQGRRWGPYWIRSIRLVNLIYLCTPCNRFRSMRGDNPLWCHQPSFISTPNLREVAWTSEKKCQPETFNQSLR
jgi:hypothetical protein